MASSPVFRKNILPWYDTNSVCVVIFFIMTGVLLFGVEGLRIAATEEAYKAYIWVPVLLVALSAVVCLSILIRLIRRYYGHVTD